MISNQEIFTTPAGDEFTNEQIKRHGGFGVIGLFGEERTLVLPWDALARLDDQARRRGLTFGEMLVSIVLEMSGMSSEEKEFYLRYAKMRGNGIKATGIQQYTGVSDT